MSRQIRADHLQDFLFPPSLDQLVPPDHPVRFIRDFVESLDLMALKLAVPPSLDGRPSYSSELLLKVWLYGYFQRIRTSRRLEAACREHVPFLWLTNMQAPDHNTLWRFWRNHRLQFKGLFKKSVQLAMSLDLVGFALQAIDGTKILAQGSIHGVLSRADLTEQLATLDAQIEQVMNQTAAAGAGDDSPQTRLPESLHAATARKQLVQEQLAKLDAIQENFLQPTDPDARMMKCERRLDMSYNAQACTDAKTGIITGALVSNAPCDNHLLETVLVTTQEQTGQLAQVTVADGGYFSGEQLAATENLGTDVLVNLRGSQADPAAVLGPFHSSKFVHDAEQDSCVCPLGQRLVFLHTKRRNDLAEPYDVRVYNCKVFKTCPQRLECCGSKRGRRVDIGPHRDAIVRQQKKHQRPETRPALNRRMPVAERTNAIIKQHEEFRRWHFRGLERVNAQWLLVCTSFNLKISWRHWRRRLPTQPGRPSVPAKPAPVTPLAA